MAISQVEKIINPLYHLETSTKPQQEERKMKRDETRKRKYRVWFRVYFDPTMWISLKRQYFIEALAPRVAN
jgi:hypothetical protein